MTNRQERPRLPCIARHGGESRAGLVSGLVWGFFFPEKGQKWSVSSRSWLPAASNPFSPTADRHTDLWHPGNKNCLPETTPKMGYFFKKPRQEPNSNLS